MKRQLLWAASLAAAVALLLPLSALAQDPNPEQLTPQQVAEMMADPAAKLILFNANYRAYQDIGPTNATIDELRFVGAGFLTLPNRSVLLYRAYLPTYSYPAPVDDQGVGDALFSAYWSPSTGNTVLGYGGALIAPTASEKYFGTQKWSAGPTLVFAQKMPGWCTFGGLLTHVWSFAGDDAREDLSLSTIQPAAVFFVTKVGTALTWTSETTYDWMADRDRWQIPMTLMLEQVLPPLGSTFFSIGVAGTWYVEKPEQAQAWDVRGTLSFIIP